MRQIIIGGEWGEYRKYANIPMRLEGGRQESNGKNQLFFLNNAKLSSKKCLFKLQSLVFQNAVLFVLRSLTRFAENA